MRIILVFHVPYGLLTRFGNSKLLVPTIDCNKYEIYTRGNHK